MTFNSTKYLQMYSETVINTFCLVLNIRNNIQLFHVCLRNNKKNDFLKRFPIKKTTFELLPRSRRLRATFKMSSLTPREIVLIDPQNTRDNSSNVFPDTGRNSFDCYLTLFITYNSLSLTVL